MESIEYQILEIEQGRTYVPRALVLQIKNNKPVAIYQLDVYGFEMPPEIDEATTPKEEK